MLPQISTCIRWLGPDGLCFFSGLFYSFILRSFTYYSFYPAHYSLNIFTTIIIALIISMPENYAIQNSTIVIATTLSRFTRDTLIKARDAYFTVELYQRRLEPVVILRNGHMTIAHCAISIMQLPCTHCPRNAISNVYTLL